MKILLNGEVENLGNVGDIVDVKPGYARNYLFPRNLAVDVTKHNIELLKRKREQIEKKLAIEKLSAEEKKGELEKIEIKIVKKSGENDVLFGSVTTMEIEKELKNLGAEIDRKKIHLDEPIKKLGDFVCKVRLFKDVDAEIKIHVEKEGEEPEEIKEEQ